MPYRPQLIVLDQEVEDFAFTRVILDRLPGVAVKVDSAQANLKKLQQERAGLSEGKKTLHLKRYLGAPMKLCPGYTEAPILCCDYQVIDLVENCPLECSYCILQAFLNKSVISLHVNIEEIMAGVTQALAAQPQRQFRVGTGEHSDSLALEHLFPASPYLIEAFAKIPNAVLELKTKTTMIEGLLPLAHQGHTVVAFSLNPAEIIRREELKTAKLPERLEAARKLADVGYKVAFHFDPLIHYPEWEKGYEEVIQQIFQLLAPREIAWISLGTLRYLPSLKGIAEERFPGCNLFSGEFVPGEGGKRQYFKPLRKKMLHQVGAWLQRESQGKTPLYICMEKASLWEKSMPLVPKKAEEVERYLTRNCPL